MHVDFLIIGQGISGTFVTWYLQKANQSFILIDEGKASTASKIAAGIINPVTGRRIVKTWMIDELLPFALQTYTDLGRELEIDTIERKDIIEFFPTPQMRESFLKRYSEDPLYLSLPSRQDEFASALNDDFGYGVISPVYLVNLPSILPAYRRKLEQDHHLVAEKFDLSQLILSKDGIRYGEINASKIIFCDGIASAGNPYFTNLPFAPNKGEVLLIESKDLPDQWIFKKSINIVPWKKNIFWVGSSYEWNFEHELQTENFRKRTIVHLQKWMKIPFTVLDHLVSVRPATIERRPFIGFHPLHENLGIFNGMGTKGCSLAPYFARQFVQHILKGTSILPEADVSRFRNILSK